MDIMRRNGFTEQTIAQGAKRLESVSFYLFSGWMKQNINYQLEKKWGDESEEGKRISGG
jgi:hypothetical protein